VVIRANPTRSLKTDVYLHVVMRTFIVKRKGTESGPYSLEQLRDLMAAGDLAPSDLILWDRKPRGFFKEGVWVPVGFMPGMPRKLDASLKRSLIISIVWFAAFCIIAAYAVVSCVLRR